ncbi:hypothetical protein [Sinomicrobium oceani]|uniref:hypothetical protein n=1 Tax=Sinomicrobium oceani TaxID=1150368 RepID=UPI00227A42D7|nr:hypothetical protein [Sinomicrobium oceani]
MKKYLLAIVSLMAIQPLLACTIFVLTNGDKVLFFNNEDFTNPNNRMWFIPKGEGHFGCMFVGYDDGSAQGGMNTEGLAFDWYAGRPVDYHPEAHLKPIRDNSSERMLEQCATVEEAIKFYQTYAEAGFAKASILIADRSGASVIIGARDGKLFFDRSMTSRVLGGQGKGIFERLYTKDTPIDLGSGRAILKQCVATGPGGTLYSTSYDLKNGDIHVHDFSGQDADVTLDLHVELEKGAHYYDMAQVATELDRPLRPLELNMHRLILFEFQPLEDREPKISSLAKSIFTEGAKGNLKAEYFSDALWKEFRPIQEDLKSELQGLGKLMSHHLVQKEARNETVDYRYVMVFENARLLQQFTMDSNGKVTALETLSSFVAAPEFITMGSEDDAPRNTVWSDGYFLPILGALAVGLIFILAKNGTNKRIWNKIKKRLRN